MPVEINKSFLNEVEEMYNDTFITDVYKNNYGKIKEGLRIGCSGFSGCSKKKKEGSAPSGKKELFTLRMIDDILEITGADAYFCND